MILLSQEKKLTVLESSDWLPNAQFTGSEMDTRHGRGRQETRYFYTHSVLTKLGHRIALGRQFVINKEELPRRSARATSTPLQTAMSNGARFGDLQKYVCIMGHLLRPNTAEEAPPT